MVYVNAASAVVPAASCAGGVNVMPSPSGGTAVSPSDGAPAVVTRTTSPSGSESLARTSNTSGAAPAIACTESSNASGARFAPAAGITPISTSPTAISPPASTSEYVKRSVPANVAVGV